MKRRCFGIYFFCLLMACLTVANAQVKVMNNPFETTDTHTKFLLFSPISSVAYIQKADIMIHSDSISANVQKLMNDTLQLRQKVLGYDTLLPSFDTTTTNRIQYELNNLVNDEKFRNDAAVMALPPSLDSVLMESGYTYGIFMYHFGFLRKKGNYSSQVWKAIGFGVLTLGNYYFSPQKWSSNMYLLWLDGKQKTINCIHRDELDNRNPTDTKELSKQITHLIDAAKRDEHFPKLETNESKK